MEDGGNSALGTLSTWLPVLSVALMFLFALLAARRSTLSWLAAGLSGPAAVIPYFIAGPGTAAFGLWPITLPTLLVPVLGWWNWNRLNRRTPGRLPVRQAAAGDWMIGSAIVVIPALASLVGLIAQADPTAAPVGPLALAVVGLFMPGVFLAALLGLAFRLVESWWLLLLHSAGYLIGSASYLMPALLGMDNVFPSGVSAAPHSATALLHVGIVVAAVLGRRAWKSGVKASPQPVP